LPTYFFQCPHPSKKNIVTNWPPNSQIKERNIYGSTTME
jgi:hypothetical protein